MSSFGELTWNVQCWEKTSNNTRCFASFQSPLERFLNTQFFLFLLICWEMFQQFCSEQVLSSSVPSLFRRPSPCRSHHEFKYCFHQGISIIWKTYYFWNYWKFENCIYFFGWDNVIRYMIWISESKLEQLDWLGFKSEQYRGIMERDRAIWKSVLKSCFFEFILANSYYERISYEQSSTHVLVLMVGPLMWNNVALKKEYGKSQNGCNFTNNWS